MGYTLSFVAVTKCAMGDVGGLLHHDARSVDQDNGCETRHGNKDIDGSRTWLNDVIVSDGKGGWMPCTDTRQIAAALDARLAHVRKPLRKDAVVLRPMILQLDPEWYAAHPDAIDRDTAEQHMMDWAADTFGRDNLVYVAAHHDEGNSHLHIGFCPVTQDGRLSQKDWFSSPARLREMHDEFRQHMAAAGYDIAKDRKKPGEHARRMSVEEYKAFARLQADREQLQADQEQLQADQEQLQADQEQLQADQEQLQADREQLQADREQLQADQEQLQADQEQLQADQEQLQADQEQLQADQEQLQADRVNARLEAQRIREQASNAGAVYIANAQATAAAAETEATEYQSRRHAEADKEADEIRTKATEEAEAIRAAARQDAERTAAEAAAQAEAVREAIRDEVDAAKQERDEAVKARRASQAALQGDYKAWAADTSRPTAKALLGVLGAAVEASRTPPTSQGVGRAWEQLQAMLAKGDNPGPCSVDGPTR